MLAISTDTFPQTGLSYVAFRISCLETFERMVLARQVGDQWPESCGYLTEVPFFANVPLHIQLDLLAETWSKHVADDRVEATLVDESVVYAACETSARIVEREPEEAVHLFSEGPFDVELDPDPILASELRQLHIGLSNEGDFLMISQFEDMLPDAARALKKKFGLDEDRLEDMFDVLSRWSISKHFLRNLSGLLTETEIARMAFELNARS